jgi:signal transduction histidine kinase
VVVGCLVIAFIDRIAPGWWGVVAGSALTVVGSTLNIEISPLGWVVFAIGCVNLIGRDRVGLRVGAPVYVAGALIIVVVDTVHGSGDWQPILWTTVGTLGVGSLAYTRRQAAQRRKQERELVQRSRELEQRSLQLIEQTRLTQAETARAAALEERGRIARDIHDVLAHSLGGLVVQLDAADAVLQSGGDPLDVGRRIQASRRLAVDGLREARHAVRELGRDTSADDHAGADLVEGIRTVVDGTVGRELGIELEVLGDPRPVPAAVAAAFSAVVREGLTNINKHAPGGPASATLLYGPDTVRLELINRIDRPGDGVTTGRPDEEPEEDRPVGGSQRRTDLAGTGGGFGLTGMSRRMADVGGRVRTERDGRRWQLTADWPAPNPVDDDQVDRRHEEAAAERQA